MPRWLPVLERLYVLCKSIRCLERWDRYSFDLANLLAGLLGEAAAACRVAWQEGDVRAAASWRQLLQRGVCVRAWVGSDVLTEWEAQAWWVAGPPQQLHPLAGGVDATEGLAAGGGGSPAAAAISAGGMYRNSWASLLPLPPLRSCLAAAYLLQPAVHGAGGRHGGRPGAGGSGEGGSVLLSGAGAGSDSLAIGGGGRARGGRGLRGGDARGEGEGEAEAEGQRGGEGDGDGDGGAGWWCGRHGWGC